MVIVADRDDSYGLVFPFSYYLHTILVVQVVGSSGLYCVAMAVDRDDSYGLVFSSLLLFAYDCSGASCWFLRFIFCGHFG